MIEHSPRTFARLAVLASPAALAVPATAHALDQDKDSSFLYYSLHVDFDVMERVFPRIEFNGYRPIEDGDRTTGLDANGLDLVNPGSNDADTVITFAPGVRVPLMGDVDHGFAFEMPLTDEEEIMDSRVTKDFVTLL